MPRHCSANQLTCIGDVYSVCDDRGSAFTALQDCAAAGQVCTLTGCSSSEQDAGIGDGGAVEQADSSVGDASTEVDGG